MRVPTSTATDTTGGSHSGSGGTFTSVGGTVLGGSTATAGGSTTTSTGGSGTPASGGTPTTGGAASTGSSTVTGGAVPNDADAALDTTAVATMPRCQSTVTGYAGVYDLSGNVCEWEDSCNGTSGVSDMCRVRDGSAYNDSASLRCDADSSSARGSAGVIGRDVGIRCCWP